MWSFLSCPPKTLIFFLMDWAFRAVRPFPSFLSSRGFVMDVGPTGCVAKAATRVFPFSEPLFSFRFRFSSEVGGVWGGGLKKHTRFGPPHLTEFSLFRVSRAFPHSCPRFVRGPPPRCGGGPSLGNLFLSSFPAFFGSSSPPIPGCTSARFVAVPVLCPRFPHWEFPS